jgi:nucleotide-binding universal stress UspA family protein
VGATVITDTLALIVLAVIAGGEGGSSGPMGNVILLAGLGGLAVYCFVVLRVIGRWFFAGMGQDRTLRFAFLVAAFLSAAVVAEVAGIEGIVGAFFAGIALNRMAPNGGPLMERVEFFGSALFIPAFLVSVGLLIDPKVLASLRTWQLAGVFTLALVLGKGSAALLIGRIRHFSFAQVQLVFSLSLAQAAATLAATTVGSQVGLFGQDVVNAVVVVIVVSLFASSIVAGRAAPLVAPPSREGRPLGAAVLTAVADPESAARLLPLVAGLAHAAGGNVIPVHVLAEGDGQRTLDEARANAKTIDEAIRRAGVETEPCLRVAGSVRQGIRNEVSELDASLLVLGRHRQLRAQDFLFGGTSEELVAASPIPTLIAEMSQTRPTRVVLPVRDRDLSAERIKDTALAAEVASLLARSGLELVVALRDASVPPIGLGLPREARLVEMLPTSRTRWVAEHARPGDIVILPGGGSGIVFGTDAARIAAMSGVSVAVVVRPYHPSGTLTSNQSTMLVGRTGAA